MKKLVLWNIHLQICDGLFSYCLMVQDFHEANPATKIFLDTWGNALGLLFAKILGVALALSLLIFFKEERIVKNILLVVNLLYTLEVVAQMTVLIFVINNGRIFG